MTQPEAIQQLLSRRDTWRGQRPRPDGHTMASGHEALDQLLQGGWPTTALTEIILQHPGIGELSLLLPVMRQCTREPRQLIWLNPPHQPFAPALARAGLDLGQQLIVCSSNPKEWLWAAQKILRSGALLLAWPLCQSIPYSELRKLQLAAAECDFPSFLFREPITLTESSPAALRLELAGFEPGGPAGHYPAPQLRLTVHKSRGRPPGSQLAIARGDNLASQPALTGLPVASVVPCPDVSQCRDKRSS